MRLLGSMDKQSEYRFPSVYETLVDRVLKKQTPRADTERGKAILKTEKECISYVTQYGKHHYYKLIKAYSSIFNCSFSNIFGKETIEILDWGCGPALATCVLLDFFFTKGLFSDGKYLSRNIASIQLIELSKPALDFGRNVLLPLTLGERYSKGVKEVIREVNKDINKLKFSDLYRTSPENVKLHLFSNILDIGSVNLDKIYELFIRKFKGYNLLICTSPNYLSASSRIDYFYKRFEQYKSQFGYALSYESGGANPIHGEIYCFYNKKYIPKPITRYDKIFSIYW